MPLVELPPLALLLADIVGWGLAHALSGYLAHRLPIARLGRDGPLLRIRPFERGGRLYVHLGIRRWKDRLPEAGDVFAGGINKRALPSREQGGIDRFLIETRRAERAHWMCLAFLPVFAIWNPPVGVALMVGYGLAANLPCILVQRYNRGRVERIAASRLRRSTSAADPATAHGSSQFGAGSGPAGDPRSHENKIPT